MDNLEKRDDEVPIKHRKTQNILNWRNGFIQRNLTNVFILILSWAVPWSVVGDDCLPGGNLFGLIVLFDACVIAGKLTELIPIPRLPPLPPLLGMLLAGFALRNIPVINVARSINPGWSAALRSLALTVILLKAGLELDAGALKKMKGVCIRLTAFPCIVEATACAIACNLLLGFPWLWGFLLGFVLGAVTPAVIVPSLLALQEKKLGTAQGIPTLVIAASSFDDVLAISAFSVILGVTFSTALLDYFAIADQELRSTFILPGQGDFKHHTFSATPYRITAEATDNIYSTTAADLSAAMAAVTPSINMTMSSTVSVDTVVPGDTGQSTGDLVLTIFRGPLEMLGGILAGILLGMLLWFIPGAKQKNATNLRTVLVSGLGVLAIFGCRRAGFPGSGALAVIVTAFVASVRWKKEKQPVSENLSLLWLVFEPLMFGLIGAEITTESMDANSVGLGIAVLLIGLVFRSLATFAAVSFAGFTAKEKLFVCFAWLPKATVQAAIGPVALVTARDVNASDDVIQIAGQIVTIAVLSILITAPLGAALIGLWGPSLLQKEEAHCTSGDASKNGTYPVGDVEDEMLPLDDRSMSVEGSHEDRIEEEKV